MSNLCCLPGRAGGSPGYASPVYPRGLLRPVLFNGGSTEVRPLGTPSKCGGSACRSISARGAAASLASSAITTSVLAFAANNVAANTKLPWSARNSFADLSFVPPNVWLETGNASTRSDLSASSPARAAEALIYNELAQEWPKLE